MKSIYGWCLKDTKIIFTGFIIPRLNIEEDGGFGNQNRLYKLKLRQSLMKDKEIKRQITVGFLGSIGSYTFSLDSFRFLIIFIIITKQVNIVVVIIILGSCRSWGTWFNRSLNGCRAFERFHSGIQTQNQSSKFVSYFLQVAVLLFQLLESVVQRWIRACTSSYSFNLYKYIFSTNEYMYPWFDLITAERDLMCSLAFIISADTEPEVDEVVDPYNTNIQII